METSCGRSSRDLDSRKIKNEKMRDLWKELTKRTQSGEHTEAIQGNLPRLISGPCDRICHQQTAMVASIKQRASLENCELAGMPNVCYFLHLTFFLVKSNTLS